MHESDARLIALLTLRRTSASLTFPIIRYTAPAKFRFHYGFDLGFTVSMETIEENSTVEVLLKVERNYA